MLSLSDYWAITALDGSGGPSAYFSKGFGVIGIGVGVGVFLTELTVLSGVGV